MVKVFEARTVVHFSLKNVGFNVGFFGTVFGQSGTEFRRQSGLNLWIVFGQSGAEFLGLFWAVPRLIFGLLFFHVCRLCVIAKMNNILVV